MATRKTGDQTAGASSSPARRPATSGTTAKKAGKNAGARGEKRSLRSDLREFVGKFPHGWGHDEWRGLVDRLRERGHDAGDEDQLGASLERERLSMKLESVQGVGPQRARSLVDRFGTLWNLRHATLDEIAGAAKIDRSLAERIQQSLR